jgi:hypothetical protein
LNKKQAVFTGLSLFTTEIQKGRRKPYQKRYQLIIRKRSRIVLFIKVDKVGNGWVTAKVNWTKLEEA